MSESSIRYLEGSKHLHDYLKGEITSKKALWVLFSPSILWGKIDILFGKLSNLQRSISYFKPVYRNKYNPSIEYC